MALVLTNEQNYENIANSIRAKNGTTETYTPEQMSAAIDAISVGSGGGDMFKANYATQSDTKVDTALNAEALGGTPASEFVLSTDFDTLSQKVDEISISDASGQITLHNEDENAHADIRAIIPTKISQLTNDNGFITSYVETDPTVPTWAKAENKPSYTAIEVGAAEKEHSHEISNVANLQNVLDGKALAKHSHTLESIGAAPTNHNHTIAQISNLQSTLDALASASGGGSTKIQIGSYTGTGACGINDKNSIILEFAPKMVIICPPVIINSQVVNGYVQNQEFYYPNIVMLNDGTTNEKRIPIFGSTIATGASSNIMMFTIYYTFNSNQLTWYNLNYVDRNQYNMTGGVYNWIAIG